MPESALNLRTLDAPARAAAIHAAADAIRSGSQVILPTETGYTLAHSGSTGGAGLWNPDTRAAILSPTVEGDGGALRILESGGDPLSAAQRRLVERLFPGPVVFVREETSTAVRVSGNEIAAAVVARVSLSAPSLRVGSATTVIAVPIVTSDGLEVASADEAAAMVARIGITPQVTLDDGPPANRRGLTIIALPRHAPGQPAYRLLREGAYEARFVEKQLDRTILFVCSGNTCRSPMAAAIAESLLRSPTSPGAGGGGGRTHIVSAGTGAAAGQPMTPDAVAVLRGMGITAREHRSRPLTRRLIAEADEVYTMTRSHLDAVLSLDPGADDKARTIDPAGTDVPDPIGRGPEVYAETARRLATLVRAALGFSTEGSPSR